MTHKIDGTTPRSPVSGPSPVPTRPEPAPSPVPSADDTVALTDTAATPSAPVRLEFFETDPPSDLLTTGAAFRVTMTIVARLSEDSGSLHGPAGSDRSGSRH